MVDSESESSFNTNKYSILNKVFGILINVITKRIFLSFSLSLFKK